MIDFFFLLRGESIDPPVRTGSLKAVICRLYGQLDVAGYQDQGRVSCVSPSVVSIRRMGS